MKVNIDDLLDLREVLLNINKTPFESIEWYQDGKLLKFKEDQIEEWKFTGLSNTDFIFTKYYLEANAVK